MATTVYRSKAQVTLANREAAYEKAAHCLLHLHALNLNLLSMVYDAPTQRVVVTLNNPLPLGQLDHLGLELMP